MHPDEWMTKLESLGNEIGKISVSTNKYFMIRVLNNLTKEYEGVLDERNEKQVMLKENNPNRLIIEDV